MSAPTVSDLGPVGRRFPIVPDDGGGGATLVAVMAVLAFLAALAAGSAALVAAGSSQWREALSREATIQIRPRAGRDAEADLGRAVALARTTPGIRSAEPVSRTESLRLLEPWLGAGLDLADLPVPRLVVLTLGRDPRPDLTQLTSRLKAELPGASLDDHSAWSTRLVEVSATVIALALAMVLLVLAASAGAVAFATRGVVAGHRDIVEVLHYVGAGHGFVARLFARRFAKLGLIGGLIGTAAAAGLFALAAGLSTSRDNDGLLGLLVVGGWTYAAILAIALAYGAVAGLVAGATVKRFLKAVG